MSMTILIRSNGDETPFTTNAATVGDLKVDSSFQSRFGPPSNAEFTVNGAPASNGQRLETGDAIGWIMSGATKGIEESPEADTACDTGCGGESAEAPTQADEACAQEAAAPACGSEGAE